MRPPLAVASASGGGSRAQEQGEAQGGSEVLVSGRVRVIRREFGVGPRILTFAPHLRGETPRRRPVARRASHMKIGSASSVRNPATPAETTDA